MKLNNVLKASLFLFFFSGMVFAAKPPGLSNSNKYPPGLEGKTPYGWEQGNKKGWDYNHTGKHEMKHKSSGKNWKGKGKGKGGKGKGI